MRPQQGVKNFFLFAALIFSRHLFVINELAATCLGFLFFSLVSSGVYVFNDIVDLEKDRLHPIKSKRPLPSGKLSISTASIVSILLIVSGLVGGFLLNTQFGIVALLYALINVFYTYKLKEVVILDVMTIAAGFVMRVAAGAVLINVYISEWLIICTVLLSLFLGFSKRRHELSVLESHANEHRAVLQSYSRYFLDQMIGVVTAATVMSYTLYTVSERTVHEFGTPHLIYTVPFVLYGIFRYLYLVHKKEEGGDPTKIVLTDKPLLFNVILWVVTASIIIYRKL
jgi:4-hydroxybenzoate polyprenyltransferase